MRNILLIISILLFSSSVDAQIKWNNPSSKKAEVPLITPEDSHLEFVRRDIIFNKVKRGRSSVAGEDGAMTVKGFPGFEKEIIHRFQTIHGECANNDWDCRPENVETYHTRSEVSHPREYRDFATIGDTTALSYEVYIAKNPTVAHLAVYDDWFNFGQLHGSGDEDVPISIAVANYDKRHKIVDENGKLTSRTLQPGSLALYLRSIVFKQGYRNHSFKSAVVLADKGEYENQWIRIDMKIHWQQDETGKLLVKMNGKPVFECTGCVTAPRHPLVGMMDGVKQPIRFNLKWGIYSWRRQGDDFNRNRDTQPPTVVAYYKNVSWDNR